MHRTTAFSSKLIVTSALAVACAFVQMSGERTASADEVSGTGKGIVGGALLGGEVVTITESLVGVHNPWAYVIGGGAGAIGGGIVGHFVENASSDGRAPLYMLAGGLALAIPAVVLTLDATRYRPSDDSSEDHAPTNGPAADPGKVGGSAVLGGATNVTPSDVTAPPAAGGSPQVPSSNPSMPAPDPHAAPTSPATTNPSTTPATPAPAPAGGPGAMFHLDTTRSQLRIGMPVPEMRPMYTALEQKTYGLPNSSEVRMQLVNVRF